MEISVSLMRQLDTVDPDLRQVLYSILEEIERQSQERVTKDEFRELKNIVQNLAQAQSRTEARLEELAQAQAKTEAEVRKLAKSHQQLQKQVGGLSDSVGYGIEDRLMPFIPEYARLEFGLKVDYLDRRNVEYPSGKYDEVNILASGRINGDTAHLIAECKAKPGKKDADKLAGMLERLADVLDGRFFPLLIGYTFAPEVERYIARKYPHISMVKTYALEMRARGIQPTP
jgi:cell division protein FtsB